jgi:hypothetical protein
MILKISQKMGENFRKMEMFPLPFMGILPIEIQYNIIVESERIIWLLILKEKLNIQIMKIIVNIWVQKVIVI